MSGQRGQRRTGGSRPRYRYRAEDDERAERKQERLARPDPPMPANILRRPIYLPPMKPISPPVTDKRRRSDAERFRDSG